MSDNKANISRQDRIRVDANDPNEVEYLHEQFPDYTHSEILEAIKENGPFRENVTAYLKSHKTENKRNSWMRLTIHLWTSVNDPGPLIWETV